VHGAMVMKLATLAILLFLCSFVRGQSGCTPFVDAPACGCTLQNGKIINMRPDGNPSGGPA